MLTQKTFKTQAASDDFDALVLELKHASELSKQKLSTS